MRKINIELNITEKYVKNTPSIRDETERVLLIDADSILYSSLYKLEEHIDEKGNILLRNEQEQLEEAKYRVNNKIQEITNIIEEWYNIKEKPFIFLSDKNNFRYSIYSEYKANRKYKKKPKFFKELEEYCSNELNWIIVDGKEADDAIYEAYILSNKQCVVSTIDKDVRFYTPNCPQYDYKTKNEIIGEFKYLTEKEAKFEQAKQLIVGDATDNVKGCKMLGEKYVKANLNKDMTDYQYIKAIFQAYLKSTKGDSIEAKNQMKMNYKVLKLYTSDEIKKLIYKTRNLH